MITGLAHLCLRSNDLERAIAFYQGVLGLTPAFDFRRETGERYGIYLSFGGRQFIEIFQSQVEPQGTDRPFHHFCLEVADLDATITALQARGVAVTEKKLGTDQSWQAWLEDPDGNKIELHQYTPQSKQVGPWLTA